MITSVAILVFSTALFIFYIQTLCQQVLRREFGRAYFQDVLNAIDLEFPRLRQALEANAPVSYSHIRLALKMDFFTLTYLLKNGGLSRRRFSWQEKLLVNYFRLHFLLLPVRYALHFHEKQSVIRLTTVLHHFANLVGERVTIMDAAGAVVNHTA